MTPKKRGLLIGVSFAILSILSIFLILNKLSRCGYFNYHNEIWADKAGYYIYLPATFKYDFQASQLPGSIPNYTGTSWEKQKSAPHQLQALRRCMSETEKKLKDKLALPV